MKKGRITPPLDQFHGGGVDQFQSGGSTASFYERTLWEHPSARSARAHLSSAASRGDCRRWKLGYAPPGWTNLVEALQRAGFSAQALEPLAFQCFARVKGCYDRFGRG